MIWAVFWSVLLAVLILSIAGWVTLPSYQFQASPSVLDLPLFYDENGVFVTDIVINNQTLAVVIDTGSSHLVVSSYKCEQCLHDQSGVLQQQNMPDQAHLVQSNDIITYGSQEDTLDWFIDQVKFPTSYHDDTVCVGGIQAKVPFGVVQKRRGSSNYSILGVGFTSSMEYERHAWQFMKHILHKTVQFSVQGNKGRLIVGSNTPQTRGHLMFPMTRLNLFYGVRLHDVILNDTISCRHTYPEELSEMIIFDTGSNMMDLPEGLFDLFKLHCLESFGTLSFIIEDIHGKFMRINLPSSVYLWKPHNKSSCIIEPSVFDMNCIIWGSLFMNNFDFWFDVDRGEVGILKLL